MTVALAGSATGSTLTGHDALYKYPHEMDTNGTRLPANGAGVLPRITLADNLDEWTAWVWAIPVSWAAARINWASIPEVATGGNVKYQFAYKTMVLGHASVNSALTTVAITPQAQGSVQFNWNYLGPSEVSAIVIPTGPFGDKPFMHCVLTRLGAGGPANGDTLAGGCSIGVAAITRVDL